MVSHRCISRKIDSARRPFDDVAAPERSVHVAQTAPRKMFGRNTRDAESISDFRILPPIEFNSFCDAIRFKQRTISKSYYESRLMLNIQTTERLNVQMVVMIMADDDYINRRQITKAQTRGLTPFWTRPGDGASALRPDRISQDVHVVHLNKRGRVIDKGDTQASFADAR